MSESAIFFDGTSSARQPVALIVEDRLVLRTSDGIDVARWAYDDIRREDAQPGRLRLSNATENPLARLEIQDAALAQQLERLCPSLDRHASGNAARGKIVAWSLAAAVSLVAVGYYGIPALAAKLTPLVPVSLEYRLGEVVDAQLRTLVEQIQDDAFACSEDPLHDRAQTILNGLAASMAPQTDEGVVPRISVLRMPMSNAVALPGGQIYVFSPLLRELDSSDQFISVIAHEMGHVVHRDGLRRLFEQSGLAVLFGFLIGDFGGGTLGVAAGQMLTNAAFSREVEQAADDYAAHFMTDHGRSPAALADALTRIAPTGRADRLTAYLQTHPLTEDRAVRLTAQEGPVTGEAIISDDDWQLLTRYCREE